MTRITTRPSPTLPSALRADRQHVEGRGPMATPDVSTLPAARARVAQAALFVGDAARPAGSVASTPLPRQGIEQVFAAAVGNAAIARLQGRFSRKPVVLIAGDQLTGKSTAARTVAQAMGGEASGTGRLVRDAAAAAHKPVEEFVKTVPASFDIELDWRAAEKIGAGEVAVFESRLAGHLGQMLEHLGRENVVSVYLVASPRERALRYLQRELSPEVRARVEPQLRIAADATLEDALEAVVALGDPEASRIATSLKDIAQRDAVDRERLMKLYGVNYQDRSAFDVVIVTDGKTPEEVQAEILAAVSTLPDPRTAGAEHKD